MTRFALERIVKLRARGAAWGPNGNPATCVGIDRAELHEVLYALEMAYAELDAVRAAAREASKSFPRCQHDWREDGITHYCPRHATLHRGDDWSCDDRMHADEHDKMHELPQAAFLRWLEGSAT